MHRVKCQGARCSRFNQLDCDAMRMDPNRQCRQSPARDLTPSPSSQAHQQAAGQQIVVRVQVKAQRPARAQVDLETGVDLEAGGVAGVAAGDVQIAVTVNHVHLPARLGERHGLCVRVRAGKARGASRVGVGRSQGQPAWCLSVHTGPEIERRRGLQSGGSSWAVPMAPGPALCLPRAPD